MNQIAVIELTPKQRKQLEPLYQEWGNSNEPEGCVMVGQVWTSVIRVKILTRAELIEAVNNAKAGEEFDPRKP